MKDWLLIFIGGGIGSTMRYGLARAVALAGPVAFPLGTLGANVLASLLLGMLVAYTDSKFSIDPAWRLFMGIGICGGFSTFSTYSFELLEMIRGSQYMSAAAYAIASMVLCVAAIAAGILVFKYFNS